MITASKFIFIKLILLLSIYSSPSNSVETKIEPINAFTTIQDAGGIQESNMNNTFLKNSETWIVDTMTKKAKSNYVANGYNLNDFKSDINAKSVYMNMSGYKFAIIKLEINKAVRSVTIMGLKQNNLYRITCLRGSNHDIPVWSGTCGNEIKKNFDIKLPELP